MAKLICFSGASNSGKTTTIQSLLNKYKDCIYLPELIRGKKQLIDIDQIRSNASSYLKLQIEVINEKIQQELDAYNKFKNDTSIILIDRSIVDSLMYCTFYLDKSSLNETEIIDYCALLNNIIEHIKRNIYHKIILFEPIPIIDYENGLRTKNLLYYQSVEFFLIKQLTKGSFDTSKVIDLETNKIVPFIDNFYSNL